METGRDGMKGEGRDGEEEWEKRRQQKDRWEGKLVDGRGHTLNVE